MKKGVWCAALLLLLTGCQAPEAEPPGLIAEAELAVLEAEVTEGEASLALQENLALWYNLNLLQTREPGFRQAYEQILFYSDGVMGSLEIPSRSVHLPIYHGVDGGSGFGHDPDTAFPTGGTGNHPVLVTAEDISLAVGDRFVIHILGRELCYQVVAVRRVWDTTAAEGMDYCSLILGNGCQVLGIRGE